MFTGIIQHLGTLVSREKTGDDVRLAIRVPAELSERARPGDSVAVNGVCLTVTECRAAELLFDVSSETLSKSRLGDLPEDSTLNIEPALLASDPVGGHFVTGHVDGVAEIRAVQPEGRSHRIEIEAPENLGRYIAPKGCITVDGVSLTINEVNGVRFGVNVVPHTWSATNMQSYEAGTRVHLEVDLIARYLERLIADQEAAPEEEDITTDYLSKQGFAPPVIEDEAEATNQAPDKG